MEHALVSPQGTGIDGKDAGAIDQRYPLGYTVGADLLSALQNSDALLLVPGNYNETVREGLIDRAMEAIELGKHILCGVRLGPGEVELLRRKCAQMGVDFVEMAPNPVDLYAGKMRRMYRPKASVIFVGELLEGMNGTDVAITLDRHFRKKGYRTNTILSSDIARICDAHSHGEFVMLDRAEDQKIEIMNYTVKHIDTEYRPDVMIIQLPGGMMPLDDIATNQFGIYAYMWSQAVAPDCFVFCSPFQAMDEDTWRELSTSFRYRYNYGIDCIHMSNAVLDFHDIQYYFELILGYVPVVEVLQHVKEYNVKGKIPMFCALNMHEAEKLCEHVENVLSSFGIARAL